MKNLLISALTLGVFTSCGNSLTTKKQDSNDAVSLASGPNTGCVQGLAINGLTGNRIELPAFDGTNGVYMVVRDQVVGASNLGGAGVREAMTGQYAICGIPTDEDYVLFAHADGYQNFEGVVHIESTVTPKGPAITTHLNKTSPSFEANLVLYPIGAHTQDLTLSVVYAGSPVKGATVVLRPTGMNLLDKAEEAAGDPAKTSNRILSPRDLRLKKLIVSTDEAGVANFAKEDLVLGGIYRYSVVPPDSMGFASTELDTTGTVVVGLQTGTVGRDPYRYTVALRPMAADVKIVQTSLESQSISPDGSLTIVFNRPVEIVSSQDDLKGALANAVDAELMPDVGLNFTSESVSMTSTKEGTVLKLSPKWKTQPNSAHEPALTITYAGIQVRAANAPGNNKVLTIPAYTVQLFGLTSNPVLVPSQIIKSDGADAQSGKPSSVLTNPITVRVVDQFGLGLKNQAVVFSVDVGGGTVKRTTDTTFAPSVSVLTDKDGIATVQWALGAAMGEQTLSARVGSLTAIKFKATSSN